MSLEELIARDGGVCVWCGGEPWYRDLTAEHLLPKARGGRRVAENLAVACRACNKRRRTRSVSAYVRAQQAMGRAPRLDLLERGLGRLGASKLRAHEQYGRRQLALLRQLAPLPCD